MYFLDKNQEKYAESQFFTTFAVNFIKKIHEWKDFS
jgi:hypothetical protein